MSAERYGATAVNFAAADPAEVITEAAVVLQCHPRIAARFVLLGAAGIAEVSVVSVDDR